MGSLKTGGTIIVLLGIDKIPWQIPDHPNKWLATTRALKKIYIGL
jgi:hypothetical protein